MTAIADASAKSRIRWRTVISHTYPRTDPSCDTRYVNSTPERGNRAFDNVCSIRLPTPESEGMIALAQGMNLSRLVDFYAFSGRASERRPVSGL